MKSELQVKINSKKSISKKSKKPDTFAVLLSLIVRKIFTRMVSNFKA